MGFNFWNRGYQSRQHSPLDRTIGGVWPYKRCLECDGWVDPKTKEHIKTMSLKELLDREISKENKNK